MKRFSPLKTLMAIGLVAGLMGSAASAGTADYKQMLDSVKTRLDSIQVDTSELGMLTVDQLGQLTGILDSDSTDVRKAMNANNLIDQAIMPTTVDMNGPEAIRLKKELKADLSLVGLDYPVDRMNIDQVNHLLAAFNRNKKQDNLAKQAAQAIYASFTNPADMTAATSNDGLAQQQDQINVKLASLGIKPTNSLTQEQVAQLSGIFNNGESETSQKAAALTLLGM